MKKHTTVFFRESFRDFFEMSLNLFIFLPYFFSIIALMKTLFAPWKNLVAKKIGVGFSFQESLNILFFNVISRFIGFYMRLSFIIFYLFLQIAYLIFLPFLFLIFCIGLPFGFLLFLFEPSPEEKKEAAKKQFIQTHLLEKEHASFVEEWFESYYKQQIIQSKWWKLSHLLAIPPLARDWSVGYTPTLNQYSEELTHPLYQSRMKTMVNRKKEIQEIEQTLSKYEVANVLIVGEKGVGKHAIIDALAKRIYEGQTNPLLMYKRILKLNMEKILAVSVDQKQREVFFEELLKEAAAAKNIILMIENLDQYVSSSQNHIDLSSSIEKYGKQSSVQCIATTTPFSYETFIFPNEKIRSLFTKIGVKEISRDEAEHILLNAVPFFEKRYHFSIPYETIVNIIEKSEFYITAIPFPEKALDLLDSACVYGTPPLLLPHIVDKVLTDQTHIPTTLTSRLKERLARIEEELSLHILHQHHAIKKLSEAIKRAFVQLGKRKKPLASFLLLGPTGVGKTETAKALTRVLFGSESYLSRFDMSLYQTKEDISHLIGSVDTHIAGLLTAKLRENPFTVLLLDEIEKAPQDILNIFLTILDEGYFTDGLGSRVDCKNLIIIATSNAGSAVFYQQSSFDETNIIDYLIKQHIFTPEFLNRFDGIILYKSLSEEALKEIAKHMIATISKNIYLLHKIILKVSDETIENLIRKQGGLEFGARYLQRTIGEEIENKIAAMILENNTKQGETVVL